MFIIITFQVKSSFNTAHFFLHNSADTEKTFLYTAICHHFQVQRKIVLYVTTLDITALLLSEKTITHS